MERAISLRSGQQYKIQIRGAHCVQTACCEITRVKPLEPSRDRTGRGRVRHRRGCVGSGLSRYGDLY